jgi:hypothetical protein
MSLRRADGRRTNDARTYLDLERLAAAGAQRQPRRVSFADLGAVVHLDEVPPELLAELPVLYGTPFSIAEFFAIYDRPGRCTAASSMSRAT